MKQASDAILRAEQASYLEGLHGTAMRALATIAAGAPREGRDPLLSQMEAKAADRRLPISDPEVACLLSIVARIGQPRLVVELGTNIGYGAVVLARAAGEAARVVTIEYSPELVTEARANVAAAGLEERVEVRHGKALEELAKISDPIDLLYVDCVKEEYPEYLALAVPKLAPRGVVLADNVLWGGQTALDEPDPSQKVRAAALRKFNQALVSRPELCGVVLPFGGGG